MGTKPRREASVFHLLFVYSAKRPPSPELRLGAGRNPQFVFWPKKGRAEGKSEGSPDKAPTSKTGGTS